MGADHVFDIDDGVDVGQGITRDSCGSCPVQRDGNPRAGGDIGVIRRVTACTAIERVIAQPADQRVATAAIGESDRARIELDTPEEGARGAVAGVGDRRAACAKPDGVSESGREATDGAAVPAIADAFDGCGMVASERAHRAAAREIENRLLIGAIDQTKLQPDIAALARFGEDRQGLELIG